MAMAASPLTVPLDKTQNFHSSLLNHALCLDSLSSSCSMFYPLSLLVNPWRTMSHVGISSDDNLRKFHSLNFYVCLSTPHHNVLVQCIIFLMLLSFEELRDEAYYKPLFESCCVFVLFSRPPYPTIVQLWWRQPLRPAHCSIEWTTLPTPLAPLQARSLSEEERYIVYEMSKCDSWGLDSPGVLGTVFCIQHCLVCMLFYSGV